MSLSTAALRKWATPLTAASFLVTAVTGVLLFLHQGGALSRDAHIWIGFGVMAVVGLHLFTNWRPFRNSLRKPLAATILALGVVVTVLTSINLTPQSGPQLNPAQVFGALSRAPVATLAQLGGQSPEAYMAALGAAGFDGVTAQSTLTELTGGDRARNSQALALALATPAQQP